MAAEWPRPRNFHPPTGFQSTGSYSYLILLFLLPGTPNIYQALTLYGRRGRGGKKRSARPGASGQTPAVTATCARETAWRPAGADGIPQSAKLPERLALSIISRLMTGAGCNPKWW